MYKFNNELCNRVFSVIPGLSDHEIGHFLGLKRQTIHGWKRNKSRPTIKHLNTIANMTKISIRWFITGKSTDYTSVSYIFYPVFYNRNDVKSLKAYEMARNLAGLILYSRQVEYLPHLEHLNTIAFISGDEESIIRYSRSSQDIRLFLRNTMINAAIQPSQKTLELFEAMVNSYIDLSYNDISAIHRVNKALPAYTTLDPGHILPTKISSLLPADLTDSIISVSGNDLTPLIINHQQVTVTTPITPDEVANNTTMLSIITLPNGYKTVYNYTLNAELLLCRLISRVNDDYILTGCSNCSKPYILKSADIQNIYPVDSLR